MPSEVVLGLGLQTTGNGGWAAENTPGDSDPPPKWGTPRTDGSGVELPGMYIHGGLSVVGSAFGRYS